MARTITEIFTEIVQIDSPTGHESEMAQYLVTLLSSLGHRPTIDEHNNVFLQTEGEGEPVFLNAHIDTVEPGRGIIPIIENGIIRSQGETILGADNKISVAAILWVLEKIKDEDIQTRPLDILFTTSEESGNYGAIGFDKSQIRAKEGYIFDKDGDLGEFISASPYYARFDIEISGRSSHAARRHEAIPVMGTLPELVSKIEALRKEGVLINIGRIEGGSVRNTVMGNLQINGEIRSFDKTLFDEAIGLLAEICDSQNLEVIVSNDTVVENPGYILDDQDLQIQREKVEKILGRKTTVTQSYGCSDANIFNENLDSLKVYVMSDGGSKNHTVDEHVTIENLELLGELLLGLVTAEDITN